MNTFTEGYEERMMVCFGQNLRHYRAERCMTLRELGRQTGISYSYLNKLELRPKQAEGLTLKKICAIANALGVPADALLFDPTTRNRTSIIRQASRRLEDLLSDARNMASVIDEHL